MVYPHQDDVVESGLVNVDEHGVKGLELDFDGLDGPISKLYDAINPIGPRQLAARIDVLATILDYLREDHGGDVGEHDLGSRAIVLNHLPDGL
ncbi:hypothetical protein GUJ93_ZPchr0009g942 [Zizania palustris]|uniref:Uncharacterized protein n=1 Tax=Zizania palustris TaxID=103762 RepID=A0A8J5S3Y7_ZIZPA|nr:hypothetical protein GUJ93_ZPchr0009g942 [Zizania palustris]